MNLFWRAFAANVLGLFVSFVLGTAYGHGLVLALGLFVAGVCWVIWNLTTALKMLPGFEERFNETMGGAGPSSRIVPSPAGLHVAQSEPGFCFECPSCGERRCYPLEPFADTAASQLGARGECCCGALISVLVIPPPLEAPRG